MELSWQALVDAFGRLAPNGTPRWKLLHILAVILIFEGVSVIILFSYAGLAIGLLSLALGLFVLLLLHPSGPTPKAEAARVIPAGETPGMKLIDAVLGRMGPFLIVAIGAAIVVLVVLWNILYSDRPAFGDLDTLTILFGGTLAAYPFLAKSYKIEASFSLMFIALVVVFLVVPQAFTSLSSGAGSSVGSAYVEYMLAKPFAGILDIIGIPATSSGNMVSIEFRDGTTQVLGISAYCAGLYSFSIFLAAFFSYVLVFERLPRRTLAVVLAIGLAIAFLGNLFRMVVIGIVGYYDGLDALLWAHENVGWIIFLSWSAVFWYLLLGYTSKRRLPEKARAEAN